ncbi:MAG: hypothetical protein JSV19_07165 [Phycisphaerales bacterium]|nr:MAG: hypothetical protein JSV19_07165 [Phycisphaerales bacterium]
MGARLAASLVVVLAAVGLVAADEYDPVRDPAVNPPSLSAAPPTDSVADTIAEDEWLVRHLRADPATLNPILMSSGHELVVKEMLFDEPVVYGPNLEWSLNRAMVDGYSESDDHGTAELRLKPGLVWHDGAPLTARDVVFSWRTILDDQVPAVGARAGVEAIVDCSAADPLTVRYRFAQPLPTNKWSVKFPIIPRHVYEKGRATDPSLTQSAYHQQVNRHPVGNGPYRFLEWTPSNRIVLQRWDEYPGPKPHFARMIFRIVADNNAALLMFKRGELDEMSLIPKQFARQTQDDRFAKVGVKGWAEQATVYCIGWNMDGSNPFFTDARVRRAMSHALNLPLIVEKVYDRLFTRCRGIFPPGSWVYNPDVALFQYDRKRAADLLDAAGWRIDTNDGWRYKTVRGADGQEVRARFEFTLSFAQESKTSPQVAAILQEDLKRLGVDMKLQALEYTTLRGRVFTHEFQAVAWAWTATPEPDDARYLFHSDARAEGRNFVSYSNPEVDALFEQARRSFDVDERRECYQRIARIVYEDAPYTFMINAPSLWAFHKRIRGVRFSPMGPSGFVPGVRDWWVPAGEAIRHGDGSTPSG